MNNKSQKWIVLIPIIILVLLASCKKDGDSEKHGTLVYEENFDGNSGWPILSKNYTISEEKDGHYLVRYYENGNRTSGNVAPQNIFGQAKKQVLEIGFKQTGGKGDVGILFNRKDSNNSSWIIIQQAGYYCLFNYNNQEIELVQDWTSSTAIQSMGKTHILRIEYDNGNIEILINNTSIYSWKNSGLPGLDRIGLGAANYVGNNDESTVIEYDYIKAWTSE